jgi:hypothetical protein
VQSVRKWDFQGIILLKKNLWTKSTDLWTIPGSVHHGPSVDGRPELAGAWPPAAPVLKGASQGAKDGEMGSGNPLKGLTGERAVVRWPGDGGERVAVVDVPVRGSLELRERRRRE